MTRRKAKRLGRRVMLIEALLALAIGCGEPALPDAGEALDVGLAPDAGLNGPDEDGDAWVDDIDNCPQLHNPEQRDRDGDGIGDECDSCPATPNGGQGGAPGQDACDPLAEREPNDLVGQGEPISLLPSGSIREVRGVIEAPTGSEQPVDRFQVALPAHSMLRVRVARAAAGSLLEPLVAVTGGAYTVPREADGLFVAARDIYAAAAGNYEITLADRRGVRSGEPKGGPNMSYALALELVLVEIGGVSAPVQDQAYLLTPAGRVRLLEVELPASPFVRVALSSDLGSGLAERGLDPILVLERADGTVLENNDLAEGLANSRLILDLAAPETIRVALDHARAYGDPPELTLLLTIDTPARNSELEPNDLAELASPLVFPGETSGLIGAPIDPDLGPPDEDWFSFDADAGQVVGISGLIRPSSQVDPALLLYGLDERGELQLLYDNDESSAAAPYLEAVLPNTGRYWLRVRDGRNAADAPFVGGPLYGYGLYSERIGIQPDPIIVSTSTTIAGVIDPGGHVVRHLIVASEPTLLDVRLLGTGVPENEPFFRCYGPNAIGLIGAGSGRALAFLPGADSYVLGVHDHNAGLGGALFSYTAQVDYVPLVGTDEIEPNDLAANATRIADNVDAVRGELLGDLDQDGFLIRLDAGTSVVAQLGVGASGRMLELYRANGSLLGAGVGAISPLAVPALEDYRLVVSGPAGPYQLLVRAR